MPRNVNETLRIEWQGIGIELSYCPEWSQAMEGRNVSHLEIRSVDPPKVPLPITNTGYLSRFLIVDKPEPLEDLAKKVVAWLDEESLSENWIRHVSERNQLRLF